MDFGTATRLKLSRSRHIWQGWQLAHQLPPPQFGQQTTMVPIRDILPGVTSQNIIWMSSKWVFLCKKMIQAIYWIVKWSYTHIFISKVPSYLGIVFLTLGRVHTYIHSADWHQWQLCTGCCHGLRYVSNHFQSSWLWLCIAMVHNSQPPSHSRILSRSRWQ